MQNPSATVPPMQNVWTGGMNTKFRPRRPASLKGKSICVIEDDYLFASETAHALAHVGAKVIGPYSSEEAALAAFKSGQKIDCAIVDIRLTEGVRFGVAAQLLRQRTPFLFLTAVNRALIPLQFSRIRVFTKPVDLGLIILAAASFFSPKPQLS
jgi:CheY-like chemotaxis protein